MKTYSYTVNGIEFPQSQKAVNEAIRNMEQRPVVIKFETWNNGKTSQRNIQVKGRGKGYFTIS